MLSKRLNFENNPRVSLTYINLIFLVTALVKVSSYSTSKVDYNLGLYLVAYKEY